jgi:uncharacterized protein (UPF0262 family)
VPRYFFKTLEGRRVGRDVEGLELPDDVAAKRTAWASLSDLVADRAETSDGPLAVKVTDAEGRLVYEVAATGGLNVSAELPSFQQRDASARRH